MRVARLEVGDRAFYLRPESAREVLQDVKDARKAGDWATITNAAGVEVQVLIPPDALVLFSEHDYPEPPELEEPIDLAWLELDI